MQKMRNRIITIAGVRVPLSRRPWWCSLRNALGRHGHYWHYGEQVRCLRCGKVA